MAVCRLRRNVGNIDFGFNLMSLRHRLIISLSLSLTHSLIHSLILFLHRSAVVLVQAVL